MYVASGEQLVATSRWSPKAISNTESSSSLSLSPPSFDPPPLSTPHHIFTARNETSAKTGGTFTSFHPLFIAPRLVCTKVINDDDNVTGGMKRERRSNVLFIPLPFFSLFLFFISSSPPINTFSVTVFQRDPRRLLFSLLTVVMLEPHSLPLRLSSFRSSSFM